MAILLDKVCDLSAFVHKGSTRFGGALECVHYANGVVEATDGALIIRVPTLEDEFPGTVGEGSEPEDCLIPADMLKENIAGAAKYRSPKPALNCARLTVGDDAAPILSRTNLDRSSDVQSRPVEGNFPDLLQFFGDSPEDATFTFDPVLLGRLCQHAAKFSAGDQSRLRLTVSGEPGSPVRLSYTTDDGREVNAVLQPMVDKRR